MITSNPNLLGQPEAILAVGSGDLLGSRNIINQSINRLWCLSVCFLTVCCCTCQSEGIPNQSLKSTVCEICGNEGGLSLQFRPKVFRWRPRAGSDGFPSVEEGQKIPASGGTLTTASEYQSNNGTSRAAGKKTGNNGNDGNTKLHNVLFILLCSF